MSQNERLRALLAEARIWVAPGSDARARIDAALAEPVEVHPSSLSDVVTLLENERDEARAEKADAYRRGAEAMREAAAATVGSNAGCSHMVCGYCPSSAEKIRALPIPEDKP
jgi:hypothetical protein